MLPPFQLIALRVRQALLICLLHFLLGNLAVAQYGFVRTYPLTDAHYYFSGLSLLSNGHALLHGSSDFMRDHAYHVRIDEPGNPIWTLDYRHLSVEYTWGRGNIGDSLFFDAGITSGNQMIMSDPFLMCYDAQGRLRWFQQYQSPEYDQFTDLSISPDGEFYGIGPTSDATRIQNVLVMKMNRQGDKVWQRTYADTMFNEAYASGIVALPQGEVLFGVVYPEQLDGYHLIRLDSSGNFVADRAYLSDWRKVPFHQIDLLPNGNLLCRDRYDIVREFTPAGDSVRTFRADGILNGFLQLADGGLILYGKKSGSDFFVQKIDVDWHESWRRDFDLPDGNSIFEIRELPNRELLLAGVNSPRGFTKGLLLRTDCEGNLTNYTHCLPPGPEYALWPNPSDGHATLSIPADLAAQPHEVQVWNTLGQRLFAQSYSPTEFVDLDLGGRSPGVYFLRVLRAGEAVWQQPWLIRR